MPDLAEILDARHEIHAQSDDDWGREERRLHGGYPMLVELERFTNETDPSYTSRQRQSPLINFGKVHASIVIGHLNEVAPMPSYGTMGDVRERKAIPRGQETPAERFHFNANGVGSNGLTFTALASGIQMRSLATGFRWTMVEMPVRRTTTGKAIPEDRPISQVDVIAGHRPFIVEYSPRAVPMWDLEDGRLNWAVVRTAWRNDGLWTPSTGDKGYYLLVRQGYTGLGGEFEGGGWWLFDPQKALSRTGTWARTKGEIPMSIFAVDESEGTDDYPAVASMPLMELNQLSSGLMNRISERNWNARQAAKSQKHILGAEPKTFNEAVELTISGSYYIPWQPFVGPDGSAVIPTIYDGANGAVESSVYAEIIRSTIEEAHEIMVRQLTSTPDSTGRSKEAGFNEATSPLLSALATRRESWENTIIPWVEMRAGAEQPSGFVSWPTEFDLTPVIQKVDRAIDRMLKIGARSPTLEARMVEATATEDGVWPTKESDAAVVRDELTASLSSVRPEQAATAQQLSAVGYSSEGIAEAVGLSDDLTASLVGGSVDGSPDQTLPEAGAVVAGQEQDEGAGNAIAVRGVTPPNTAEADGRTATRLVPPSSVPTRPEPPRAPDGRVTMGLRPASLPDLEPEPEAPTVDLTPVTERLDTLTAQIAALVAALSNQRPAEPPPPQQPPAPVVVPIMVPQQSSGKSVSVTTPEGRTWNVEVQPVSTNGTEPPNA